MPAMPHFNDEQPASLRELAGVEFKNISNEEWREYAYPGHCVHITKPEWLHVKRKEDGTHSHYVIDKEGVAHYMPAGFVEIRWKSDPPVSFV